LLRALPLTRSTLFVQANSETEYRMGAFAEPWGHSVGEHVKKAHETLRGEHQLAEYVSGLTIEDCARILAGSPARLPALAALRAGCRVGSDERRSFEEVIRVWTLEVLSGIEG
jgi:hypothetical protein